MYLHIDSCSASLGNRKGMGGGVHHPDSHITSAPSSVRVSHSTRLSVHENLGVSATAYEMDSILEYVYSFLLL